MQLLGSRRWIQRPLAFRSHRQALARRSVRAGRSTQINSGLITAPSRGADKRSLIGRGRRDKEQEYTVQGGFEAVTDLKLPASTAGPPPAFCSFGCRSRASAFIRLIANKLA